MTHSEILPPNSLSFIALCNEFCSAVERVAAGSEPVSAAGFVAEMTRLLPRIYIAANDLSAISVDDNAAVEPSLTEEQYNAVSEGIASLLGADDVYLEVFLDDMKYSDTPISASVSEGIADIFQALYNGLTMVRDNPTDTIPDTLYAMRLDFDDYWSQILCNVMRPLNQLKQTLADADADMI